MGIDNVSKPAISPEAINLQPTTAAQLVSGLPPAALYAEEFQPLLKSVDPAQSYPFSPIPLPYAKSDAYAQFLAKPELFVNTLQSASDGLESVVGGLDIGGTDAEVASLLERAKKAQAEGRTGEAADLMRQAQVKQNFMIQMISIIGSMQLQAIRNMKLS